MMSASSSVDAYDAQMLDFPSDPDVPMHVTGSAEFFAEALMDHDGHLSTSAFSEHPSVEVDMEEYIGDNAEYEMGDETAEYPHPHGDELLDIEVYDASHAPSPLVPPQALQPLAEVPIDSGHPARTSPSPSEHAAIPASQGEPQPEVHPAPLDRPVADISHVEPSAPPEVVSLEAVVSERIHPSDTLSENQPPASESHGQPGDLPGISEQLLEAQAPAGADDAESHVPSITEEPAADSGTVPHDSLESQSADSAPHVEHVHDTSAPAQDEKATDQAPATEEESADPLHISDGVYIDLPPAVLLSVDGLSEPGFALFCLPDVEGEPTEESSTLLKTNPVLLENRPTLYYEPLSSVFEALRQDEGLLSRLPHSFEGELVLDAYDLQLVVSEDNVHSREISLHDLNILHDGSDFVGPLRLLLRATIPRFIIRYYALQEQIQRLHAGADTREGEHDYGNHEHYDVAEEQPLHQREVASLVSTQATVASEGLETPLVTEVEAPIKEPVLTNEPTEEIPQEKYEAEDTAQEPPTEHHEVTGEVAQALKDENDYESTNVNGEREFARSDGLDADQVHDADAEDTDAPAVVVAQESEFGGEHTEYVDYVQSEEYDERYGEELPEHVGGALPAQDGESLHYDEEGEQDPSAVVDETQTILPGSDDEEEKSTATPTSAHPILSAESSEHTSADTNDEPLLLPNEEILIPSSEALVTSESKDESDYVVQVSGNREPSADQARIFSGIDEPDSNFVSMLEREADAEFDRSFNAQSGQEGSSIEGALQHDEAWDEWDDEDAEGDNEEGWIDPDADSNESSITLSSKASSKRNYDELEPSEEPYPENPQNSPGLKRPRVQ